MCRANSRKPRGFKEATRTACERNAKSWRLRRRNLWLSRSDRNAIREALCRSKAEFESSPSARDPTERTNHGDGRTGEERRVRRKSTVTRGHRGNTSDRHCQSSGKSERLKLSSGCRTGDFHHLETVVRGRCFSETCLPETGKSERYLDIWTPRGSFP